MSSSVDDEDYIGTARATSRVGADLRAARERLGWTLPAIAAYIRIRLPFLEAIEAGRLGDLPGNAYAVGFLRTYAQALGLDPDEIARRFKSEAADVNRKTELTFPAPVPERGIPAGALVLLGVVIAIGAYIGWYRMSGSDQPSSDMVQAVPERLAPLAATAAPVPLTQAAPAVPTSSLPAAPAAMASAGAGSGGPTMPVPGSAGSAAMGPAMITASVSPPVGSVAAVPMPPTGPAATATAAIAGRPVMGPPVPPAIAASLAAAAPGASAGAVPLPGAAALGVGTTGIGAPDGTRIILRAKADAWVQVREKQGAVLLNRVMRNGETWAVPASKLPLLLTTGNAAGTELVVDGQVAPPLGGEGAVRRDLPLDAEIIREGKLGPLPAVNPSGTPIPSRPAATAAGASPTRTN